MSRKTRPNTRETRPEALRTAMLSRVNRSATASGKVVLPAIPALVDHYTDRLGTLFRALGRPFTAQDLANLRGILVERIDEAWSASQYGLIEVTYETDPYPAMSLTYTVRSLLITLADKFEQWFAQRKPPYFGSKADARLLALAATMGPPGESRVLDVGAGTGRNTLALARLGFPVDALEMTAAFCKILRETSAAENLDLEVIERNFLDPDFHLSPRYRLVLLSEVVSDFRTNKNDLRLLFERASEGLVSGGYLLFNCFVPCDGHVPSRLERELSEVCWASAFTTKDLARATDGLRFELVSDDSVLDFEQGHLPEGDWPPIWWYPGWVSGQDIYDLPQGKCPIEMRWLVYRRM